MRYLFCLLCSGAVTICSAQDLAFGRRMVDTLTSAYFQGRGYTNDGMKRAADFLAGEFRSYGLKPLSGNSFKQEFTYPANTFPGKMALTVNGQTLQPGRDFIVSPESRGVRASGRLAQTDSNQFLNRDHRLVLLVTDTLTWSAAPVEESYTAIEVRKRVLQGMPPERFVADIEQRFVKQFAAANVCGMVRGTRQPDSMIVMTAHYDHLGNMGSDTYFPGANDNASGTALLLNLAHYYGSHPQPYTMVFILFAGEEIGLKGSEYFVAHPLVSLQHIRFLLNTDLAGTGDDGITVVNATEFPKEFALMQQINEQQKLLTAIRPRGKAQNSDHYHFTEKGVPAFFFYTQGGIAAYHDINDRAETLPMNEHEDLFKLVVSFNKALMLAE